VLRYISFSDKDNCPYSDLVCVDDQYLYFSGLVSQDLQTGEILHGDIEFETRQILNNLETLLQQYGSGMDHVIRAEVLLSDFSHRDQMNIEYVKHFPAGHLPARLCYGNVGLADGCLVEIVVIAHKG